jgi:hypothetical protein
MLDARAYVSALNAFYIRRRRFSRKIRVFAEIFEVTSAARIAFYIYPRTEKYIDLLVGAFFGESLSEPRA